MKAVGRSFTGTLRKRTAGRLRTEECRARPGIHGLAQHFFIILPSFCVRSLISDLEKRHFNPDFSPLTPVSANLHL